MKSLYFAVSLICALLISTSLPSVETYNPMNSPYLFSLSRGAMNGTVTGTFTVNATNSVSALVALQIVDQALTYNRTSYQQQCEHHNDS